MSLKERFWDKVDLNGPVIIEELGECWVWTGCIRAGYGMIRADGQNGGMLSAHRLSWAWDNDVEYPHKSVIIRHKCDNPPCIRPTHLEDGTYRDNNHDTLKRGRLGHSILTNELVAEARHRAAVGESLHDIIKDMPDGTQMPALARAVRGESFPYADSVPVPEPSFDRPIYRKLTEDQYREIVEELSKPVRMLNKEIAARYGVDPSLITLIKKDKLKTIKRASFGPDSLNNL